ncbi:MAG: Gfo/Idh/MocA family oxidoreductase [Bacteroidales bacterium]
MAEAIQTGLASYGLSGQVFHAPFLETNAGFNIKKVWERTKNLSVQRYPHVEIVRNYEEILNDKDIELIIVNTPDTTHYELTKQALEAGKHVVVEKPFTLNSKEGEELAALAGKKNLVLSVYQNRRWDGDFKTVQQILDEQLLGRLVEYEAHYDRYKNFVVPGKWKEQASSFPGLIYDLGAHMIDQALVLFGMPESVTADLRTQRPGSEVNDYFNVKFNFPETIVTVKGGFLVREKGPRYIIHGTEGSFLKWGVDPQEQDLIDGYFPEGPDWGKEEEKYWGILNTHIHGLHHYGKIETLPGNYHGYFDNIYYAIRKGEKLAVPAEQGINVIRVAEASLQSNEENRAVKLK